MTTQDPRHRYHPDTDPDAIGIALAGGGVRAACLGLGALQAAEEAGVLGRARYVSAVSGGSYIATAFIASRARTYDQAPDGPAPWSRGSPEEAHLRKNLRYLSEDLPDLLLALTRYVISMLINLVPFAAAIVLAGCALGAVYQAAGLLTAENHSLTAHLAGVRWPLAAGAGALAVLLEARLPHHRRPIRQVAAGLVALALLPDIVALSTHLLDTRVFDASAGARLTGLLVLLALVGVGMFRSQRRFPVNRFRQLELRAIRLLFDTIMTATLVLPLLLTISQASQSPARTTVLAALAALAILLVFGCAVHANSTSLHGLYAHRLDRAYVVRASSKPVRLSDVTLRDTYAPGLPELLICASVNLRESESAEGEGCASFVFSAEHAGCPELPEDEEFDTPSKAVDLVATSGAAVAPNMGRYTNRASRIALTLLNLRLGMWLRNPAADPPPRLWPLPQWLVDGWLEPGPLATWREALGDLSLRHRFVFVSDGAHWDNSGIVELLRRRCHTIYAVDASIDDARLGNLLRVISLARTELGVEFATNGRLLESREPILRIEFTYRDGSSGLLMLLRTHISQEMPGDLVALSADRGAFPRHSTLNQFLAARDVDAYIALGRWLFQRGSAVGESLSSQRHAVPK